MRAVRSERGRELVFRLHERVKNRSNVSNAEENAYLELAKIDRDEPEATAGIGPIEILAIIRALIAIYQLLKELNVLRTESIEETRARFNDV